MSADQVQSRGAQLLELVVHHRDAMFGLRAGSLINDLVRWPRAHRSDATGVAVATVNYNTRALIALWLWSIHRLPGDQVRAVAVVDNGSSDGSRELLAGTAEGGLCKIGIGAACPGQSAPPPGD